MPSERDVEDTNSVETSGDFRRARLQGELEQLQGLGLQQWEEGSADAQQWLFAAIHSGPLWEPLGALVLLVGHLWLTRKQCRESGKSPSPKCSWAERQQDREEEKEEDREDEEEWESTVERQETMCLQQEQIQRPTWIVPDPCKALKELLGELLSTCHMLTLGSFFPRLGPGIHVEGASGDGSYSLLVPLLPPPGHAFQLETANDHPCSPWQGRVRVQLKCVCARQQLFDDTRCLLHQPAAPSDACHVPCLLCTLCTRSFLDVHKTARWFRHLLQAAWLLLPTSRNCRLVMLSCARTCQLRLHSASGSSLLIHIIFGVRQGNLAVFWTEHFFSPFLYMVSQ
ncbi:PREDICTED: inositol 1,4,5-trisphosphate receptor-interacting protein-like 1 [Tinamus guttatus]|uniref:inositol 1,4,5-trisphosphate receptor-interacting protein-like 1 n=1 Tax=Tinamus guttatus TaxID=94827 RepID=UPI00052E88B1|nr:PREDICTED: inositol 1,4,5-trisphosphate receptor-interacting protein-like 1 [Tinamus guttatus]